MEFTRSLHAKLWVLAAAAGVALAALAAIDDAPPGPATPGAAATLSQWQAQFAQGLQVSLRAVADGNDRPGRAAEAPPASAAASRLQPIAAEPAFSAKTR
jgi:hypothetical protein